MVTERVFRSQKSRDKEKIVEVGIVTFRTKQKKKQKMLTIHFSEICMPCPSYMKLYNLHFSIQR